jgi:hypothetical protein
LYGDAATTEALAEAATGAPYVHLACHGTFDVLAPLESGLELADGRLSVRDVLEKRPFAGARLAVASACKSAVYDVKPPRMGVAGHPDSPWTTQQVRNLIMDFGEHAARFRFLVRDRAGQFTALFDAVVADAGHRSTQDPPRCPRANCSPNGSC